MPLTVSCRCGQVLAVKEEHAGKAVACPVCHGVFTVPAPANPPAPAPAAPAEDELPGLVTTPEDELPELTNVEILDEDEKTYQIKEGQTDSVEHSLSGCLARVRLRAGPIECLAYGPDHQTALTADEEALYFLDLKAKQETAARSRHRDPITCLAFAADGRHGLSGDADGGLLLWDVSRRKSVRWLEGHRDEVTSAAFSPDGGYAVSGDMDGAVRLWEVGTGKPLSLAQARWEESVSCVGFSPDGRLILGLGERGKARLWDFRTGAVARKLKRGARRLRSAAFRSDGACVLASSEEDFLVNRWDVATGERQPCFVDFAERQPRIRQTWVAPNGRALLALGFFRDPGPRYQGETSTWMPGGPLVTVLGGLAGHMIVYSAAKTAQALDAALAGQPTVSGYYLEFWDAEYETGVKAIALGPEKPSALACSADGHRVLAGFANGSVSVYAL
jgi:WD40 repeat protein